MITVSNVLKIPVKGIIVKRTPSGQFSIKCRDNKWQKTTLSKIRNVIGKQKFTFADIDTSLFINKNSIFVSESIALSYQYRNL